MSLQNGENTLSQDEDNSQSSRPPTYAQYLKIFYPNGVENEKLNQELDLEGGSLKSSQNKESQISDVYNKSYFNVSESRLDLQTVVDEDEKVKIVSGSQKRDIFLSCMAQYLVTFALCGFYGLVTKIWLKKIATSEFDKRIYNTIVTGISIALGLNISSAFRDIALTVRWSVLALGRQNLEEMNLMLQPESLMSIAKLARVSRRPIIISGCILWLFVNIITQVGLALLSLTYNFDMDPDAVQLKPGEAAIPRMDHFYPQTNHVVNGQSLPDEQYTAHTYGEFALNFGIGLVSSEPKAGKRYLPTDPLLWLDKSNSIINFVFLDSPKDALVIDLYSAFTARKISITYKCKSYHVLSGGDGRQTQINVDTVGNVLLPQAVPDSTTFLTRSNHTCKGNSRCSVVEAFESSATDPWYYVCEISLGNTQNDPFNVSYVSDYLAQIATASIAQIGYTDNRGFSSQVYPRESLWSQVAKGDADSIGMVIGICALSSIAGAAQFNPFTSYMSPLAPSPGFLLKLNHRKVFISILILINISHLIFVILVMISARKVKTGPYEFTELSLLLKPVTSLLTRPFGKGKKDTYDEAMSQTYVRYERENGEKDKWKFNIYPG